MEYITYQDAPDMDVDMDDEDEEELPSLGDEDEEVPDEVDGGTTPNDEM